MKMFHREWKEIVEVVNFVGPQKGVQIAALVFSPNMLEKQNGNGWVLVKMGKLVPLDYMSTFTDSGYMTKTLKNRIKERLQLKEAKWESTDGIVYDNIDDAIEHEYKLLKQEDMANLVKIPEHISEEGINYERE